MVFEKTAKTERGSVFPQTGKPPDQIIGNFAKSQSWVLNNRNGRLRNRGAGGTLLHRQKTDFTALAK